MLREAYSATDFDLALANIEEIDLFYVFPPEKTLRSELRIRV